MPDMAAGLSSFNVAALSFGTHLTHSLELRISDSISSMGTFFFSLIVNPWAWHRIEPTRTQIPSTGMGLGVSRILLVSA